MPGTKNATTLRPAGWVQITDVDGEIVEADTLQCVHCGCHWQIQPGSGIERGFCSRCNGPVCGRGCAKCVPAEQQLENLEAFLPVDHVPTRVSFWMPNQSK